MTPLLDALVAAQKVGLDAPVCAACLGRSVAPPNPGFEKFGCHRCDATGLDASDPERLIGRADMWLHGRACDVLRRWATNEVVVSWSIPASALAPGATPPGHLEPHDGTPTGLATALLRLVARVGGAE